LFHHDLFCSGYLLAQKTLERDRDFFNLLFLLSPFLFSDYGKPFFYKHPVNSVPQLLNDINFLDRFRIPHKAFFGEACRY
jgi:hypothetical protein